MTDTGSSTPSDLEMPEVSSPDDITPLRSARGLRRIRGLPGELLAEFIGCLILISFGDGVVAMAVAALPGSGRTASATTIFTSSGSWMIIVWGWAFAVAFAVWVAGGVSGAHINPAVTVAFAVRRSFPWKKVPAYILAQIAGCFAGAAVVFANYHGAIAAYNAAAGVHVSSGKALASFSIFATFPASYFHGSWSGPLLDQVLGTAFLVMFVVAVIDRRNSAAGSNLAPLIVGLIVAAIGLSFGANAGYAINPARDLGPRLFAWLAGWGSVAVPGTLHTPGLHFTDYMWIPIIGPLIGGVIGVVAYDWFIGDVLHARASSGTPEPPPGAASEQGAPLRPSRGADEGRALTQVTAPEARSQVEGNGQRKGVGRRSP